MMGLNLAPRFRVESFIRAIVAACRKDPSILVATLLAGTFLIVTSCSIPALRHDWTPSGLSGKGIFLSTFGGWSTEGIGAPQPYSTAYIALALLSLGTSILGASGAFCILFAVIGALCAFGSRAIAIDAGAGTASRIAATVVATLNPWVYTELVAGHVLMLLAYAASFWLFREVIFNKWRTPVVIASALATMPQVQFFVVSSAVVGYFAMIRRDWRPAMLIIVMWLPTIIGVTFEYRSLETTPFILAWEQIQSLDFMKAVQLNGYFAGYGGVFTGVFSIPIVVTGFVALAATFFTKRRAVAVGLVVLTLLVFASGSKSMFAGIFAWSVLHVRGLAVYRELYDVIGYVAIGYVLLACCLSARLRLLEYGWLAAAILLPFAWISSPPQHYWVPLHSIPAIHLPHERNSRFALLPAFQPMSFLGRGLGADPDLYGRPDNFTPLNQYFAGYPVSAALSQFVIHGDSSALAGLSVSLVVERPWLRTSRDALHDQVALPTRFLAQPEKYRVWKLQAVPELSLLPMPSVGSLTSRQGSGNIFFADARAAKGNLVPSTWQDFPDIVRVVPPSQDSDASRGWVDSRLGFSVLPEIAQSLGGALTTSRKLLPVEGGLRALVYVDGVLQSASGEMIVSGTRGYRWIRISNTTKAVRCIGLCVVAAEAPPLPQLPLNPAAHRAEGVDFKAVLPAVILATLPAGEAGVLRYNVSYDPRWKVFWHNERPVHVRLDGTVNGWLIPKRTHPEHIYIVQSVGIAQVIAQAAALVVVGWIAVLWLSRRFAHSTDRRQKSLSGEAATP